MAKKKAEKKSYGAPEYMLTYGDMVTLLLTFFVAMFTFGEADPRDMRLILSSFSGNLGVFEGGMTLSKGQLADMGMSIESLPSTERGSSMARSVKQAQEILKPEIRSKMVRVSEDERGIVISLASDTFFGPGSARLNLERGADLLKKVVQLVERATNQKLRIEGHTDDTPVGEGGAGEERYRDNWQLSTARALAVLAHMTKEGVPGNRLQVGGFADNKPIESNDTPEGRAYNRRVDIVMLRN